MSDLSSFDLTGKKALITGSAMGIGRSCAFALATAGADVAIVDRDPIAGENTAAALRKRGCDAIFVPCDVTQPGQVKAMVETVAKHFGRLDIAVNNAGIYIAGKDEDQTIEEWNTVISVNLTGTWLCCQAVAKQMMLQDRTEGKIINLGSLGAFTVCSNGSYDASKAGVVHLTKTLAARWGRYNINVNSISPGYVIAGMAKGRPRSDEERKLLRGLTPMGYVQRFEDLHGPLVFLASSASNYVTGINLIVDGGHALSPWLAPLERSVPPRISPEAELHALEAELNARPGTSGERRSLGK